MPFGKPLRVTVRFKSGLLRATRRNMNVLLPYRTVIGGNGSSARRGKNKDGKEVLLMKAEFSFSKDHPSLDGHFPGEPIIPGVTLLVRVQEVIHDSFVPGEVYRLRSAKFLRPVRPGETLKLSWEKGVSGDLAFHCAIRGELAMTGIFSLLNLPGGSERA